MKKWMMTCAMAAMMACGVSYAAEVESGLSHGTSVPAFTVHDVTGPQKGEDLCYRCRYGAQPVVSIFTKEVTPEVAQLTKKIDGVVAENRDAKMAGFVVLTADKPSDAHKTKLEELAKKEEIKQVPLTTFEGANGPKGYKLNSSADVTVMMWVDNKVVVNRGFSKADINEKTIASIVEDTKKILK